MMDHTLEDFEQFVRPLMIEHLVVDILPYWTQSSMLGNPIGRFPTYASQLGVPDYANPIYVRMHGRQTYGYLAAYLLLKRTELLFHGLAGLKQLEKYENPLGGYYSIIKTDGTPDDAPVSIQDQCYSVFPYIMAYRVTNERKYLDRIISFMQFIDSGPYLISDGSYIDSLCVDLKTVAHFETGTMNIVSVIDFLNVILIPVLSIMPQSELTSMHRQLLGKWVDLMVGEFYGNGIFWNEKGNRSDWRAKHVDLGHTSKAYGILFKANRLFAKWGMPARHAEIMDQYPEIVKAAARTHIGWRTDYLHSPTTFTDDNLQWWRHILINQTVYHYAHDYPELLPLLKQGVEAWFSCDYVDRIRTCRGIREGLSPEGCVLANDDNVASKANCWKSAYHEIEHVLTFVEGE